MGPNTVPRVYKKMEGCRGGAKWKGAEGVCVLCQLLFSTSTTVRPLQCGQLVRPQSVSSPQYTNYPVAYTQMAHRSIFECDANDEGELSFLMKEIMSALKRSKVHQKAVATSQKEPFLPHQLGTCAKSNPLKCAGTTSRAIIIHRRHTWPSACSPLVCTNVVQRAR